jgi:geranylgeranyl reductase family protein
MTSQDEHKVEWQYSLDTLPEKLWDAIIVGAGPAGSTTAWHLARAGHDVLLLDRARFPREKVCGDGLIADSLDYLKREGLFESIRDVAHSLNSALIYSPSRHSFDVPGEYLVLERKRLDTIVAKTAVNSGAKFCRGDVRDVIVSNSESLLSVGNDSPQLRAKIVVLATGARVDLARKLGILTDPSPYAFAVRCYVKSPSTLDKLILSYDNSLIPGYGWIMPIGHGVFNIGCGTTYDKASRPEVNLRETFQSFISGFPLARELLADGEIITPLKGAPLRCGLLGSRSFIAPSVIATGETIGATYPFTGEGIGKAFETGALAAQVVHQALESGDMTRLEDYPRRLETEIRPKYRGYLAAEHWLGKPWLNDYVTKRISRSEYLHSRFKRFVKSSGDPRTVYTIWSLLQSYWK